jgi:uncharacterized protein YdbL (DUF1318 family)
MTWRWLIAAASLGLSLAPPLVAQSSPVIVAARGAGQVGERYDGYLGYATAPSPRLRDQVESINIRRRSLYSGLAVQSRASRVDVGIASGCGLLSSVAVGEAYLLADNVWRRRAPGEAMPTPNYCRP